MTAVLYVDCTLLNAAAAVACVARNNHFCVFMGPDFLPSVLW